MKILSFSFSVIFLLFLSSFFSSFYSLSGRNHFFASHRLRSRENPKIPAASARKAISYSDDAGGGGGYEASSLKIRSGRRGRDDEVTRRKFGCVYSRRIRSFVPPRISYASTEFPRHRDPGKLLERKRTNERERASVRETRNQILSFSGKLPTRRNFAGAKSELVFVRYSFMCRCSSRSRCYRP